MSYAETLAENNYGKPIEVEDASNRDQCMDWAFFVCDSLGIPRETIRHFYAYQVFTEPNDLTRQYFVFVPNFPDNYPPPGAFVVWAPNVGAPVYTGRAGHIAWSLSGCTTTELYTADQNWEGHSYVEKVHHTYDGVMGWLIPKQFNQSNQGNNEVISNPDDVRNLYLVLLGRAATDEEAQAWVGQTWHDAYYQIKDSQEGQAYRSRQEREARDLHTQVESQQKVIGDLSVELTKLKEAQQTPPAPTPVTTTPSVVLPTSNTDTNKPIESPVNTGNGNTSGFSFQKYNKAIVAGVGVGIAVAARFLGADDPILTAIIGAATTFGVYQVPNRA